MGHIPEDDNFDEFMDASAEDWSEPEEATPLPETQDEANRWGSPTPQEGDASDTNRWGSEPLESSTPGGDLQKTKGGRKWWVIAIIVVVVLCLCLCLGLFAVSRMGIGELGIFDVFRNRFIP